MKHIARIFSGFQTQSKVQVWDSNSARRTQIGKVCGPGWDQGGRPGVGKISQISVVARGADKNFQPAQDSHIDIYIYTVFIRL